MDDQFFSPSFMLCLKDLILPYHLLRYILDSYRGDMKENEFDNMFLSPILAPNSLLKLLPPVRIIIGSADPLRDDNFRFLHKLM